MRYHDLVMQAKKIFLFVFLPLLLGSLVYSQTLAEIASKEKERRESLKGKKAKVITNAELAKMKKKPALEIPPAELPPAKEEAKAAQPPSPPTAQGPQSQPPSLEPVPADKSPATLSKAQQRWEKAKEYVDLLTLKMGTLWQEYNGLDATASKEPIQLAISETFIKLEQAQEEEGQARQELERLLGQAKKDSVPSIWIR
jgi:hypothetical protein